MKQHPFVLVLSLTLVALLAGSLTAEELSVEEIVNRANLASYYGGDDGRAEVSMTITDGKGRTRNRDFVILRRDVEDGGDQFFYVYFKKPSDVRKMVFMVHKHIDRDDDRWLYLPAMDLVKRIAASDKRTSFVGSHFLYEDVSGRSIKEDEHRLLESDEQYYVLESTPKDSSSVEFSSYKIWIDKQNFIPMKAEYIDKSGKQYRLVEALKVQDFDGIPTVTVSRISDLVDGSNTQVEMKSIRYNVNLKDDIFTERYLRRPPREVRR
jgi:outer membrane lipoprotein-sorting protein